jgi:hypothetical protein
VRRHLLLAEKDEIVSAFRHGRIDREAHNQLLADIDARLLQVESGESPQPATQ